MAILTLALTALLTATRTPATTPADYTELPDLWTCGAQDWGPNEARCVAVTDGPVAGKTAIALNYNQGYQHYLAFPKWRNAGWDMSGVDYVEFKVKLPRDTSWRGANPIIFLRSRQGPFLRIQPAGRSSLFEKGLGEWQTIRVPLTLSPEWERFSWLGGGLTRVDFIELAFSGGGQAGTAHSVLVDDVKFGPKSLSYSPPDETKGDLDVLLIERAPLYRRYVLPGYDSEKEIGRETDSVKHQPVKGEEVTYTARVQNKGKTALGGDYQWVMDGKVVASGKLGTLKPREKASATLKWRWDPADHDLTFRLTPGGADYCAENDAVTIRTNALMYKFMIERGLIARMESKVNVLGSYSLEDWLQGQIRFMNQLFAHSTYPFAPKGVTQRVCVGMLEYVDDGYLPTLGGGPFRVGELDARVDGGRGLTALDDPWNSGAGAPCFLNFIGRPDDAWLHELSHQIGLIDDYQFIVEPEANKVNGVGFNYSQRGLMGGGDIAPHQNPDQLYSLYSPSNVQGLNATKGRRRGFFGEYLFCMPRTCRVRLLDERGEPIANAKVAAYQTQGREIDAVPEHQGRTDAAGAFTLSNRKVEGGPFTTASGCTLHDNPFGFIHVVGFNGVMLITADCADGKQRYGFFTVPEFNVEYASGHTDVATIPVRMQVKGDERSYMGRL